MKKLTILTLLGSTLLMNSCKKEVVTPTKSQQESSTNMVAGNTLMVVDQSFTESMTVIEALNSGSLIYKTDQSEAILTCATVTNDTVAMPHVYHLDFGTGCVGGDGSVRSGVIDIQYNSKHLADLGSYANITFVNYKVDSNQYNGTLDIVNDGFNGNSKLTFSLDINVDYKNVNTNAEVTTTAAMDIEWASGFGTSTREDDLLSMTGNINGFVTGTSSVVNINIMDPLIKSRAASCNTYFIQGQIRIVEAGNPDTYLDYGTGECDDKAIETINGSSQTIQLEGYFK